MKLEYDARLVEQAVFHRTRNTPVLESVVHALIDPIYDAAAGAARDDQFRCAYAELFQQLELGRFLEQLLAEQPVVSAKIHRCLVREAARKHSPSIELYQQDENPDCVRTLLVQLTPADVADPDGCRDEMRRELQHVADMLDDDFGYRAVDLTGNAPHQNLVRDRYHVLWNIDVERRLMARRLLRRHREPALLSAFLRAFAGREEPRLTAFDALWSRATWNHEALLQMAGDPSRIPGWSEPMGRSGATAARDGEPCSLCGFSTYDWFELDSEDGQRIISLLTRSRRSWQVGSGVCRQCAEACLSRCQADPVLC